MGMHAEPTTGRAALVKVPELLVRGSSRPLPRTSFDVAPGVVVDDGGDGAAIVGAPC